MTSLTGRQAAACVLLMATVLAAGCTKFLINQDPTVGYEGDRLAFVPTELTQRNQDAVDEAIAAREASPSTPTLSRDHWPMITVGVPSWPAAHQPIYSANLHTNTDLPRNRGRFPTPASSVDTITSEGYEQQLFEAATGPLVAMFDIAAWIPRAVVTRPFRPTRSGLEAYERAPRPAASRSEAAASPADPEEAEFPRGEAR